MSFRSLAEETLREALTALERCTTDAEVRTVLEVVHGGTGELLDRSGAGLSAEITPTLSRAVARLSAIRGAH